MIERELSPLTVGAALKLAIGFYGKPVAPGVNELIIPREHERLIDEYFDLSVMPTEDGKSWKLIASVIRK